MYVRVRKRYDIELMIREILMKSYNIQHKNLEQLRSNASRLIKYDRLKSFELNKSKHVFVVPDNQKQNVWPIQHEPGVDRDNIKTLYRTNNLDPTLQ